MDINGGWLRLPFYVKRSSPTYASEALSENITLSAWLSTNFTDETSNCG